MIGRLASEQVPSPDFRVFGPFGERAGDFISGTADVLVGGQRKRRRIRGPTLHREWQPCWNILGGCLRIAEATPSGPIKAYKDVVDHLAWMYPHHWSIISFAEENNRMERWAEYRQDIEDEVRAGNPPVYYDEDQPWAAVLTRAAEDDKYWETHVEKPIDRSRTLKEAAERAAMHHRNFLPPSAVDGYDAMVSCDAEAAAGPYERPNGRSGNDRERPAPTPPNRRQAADSQQMSRPGLRDGMQYCYTWNRKLGGCQVVCPHGRLHICEYCPSTEHRSIECMSSAGIAAREKSNGRKGRKGRGKGEGRK